MTPCSLNSIIELAGDGVTKILSYRDYAEVVGKCFRGKFAPHVLRPHTLGSCIPLINQSLCGLSQDPEISSKQPKFTKRVEEWSVL
jgi:hypothetical protein